MTKPLELPFSSNASSPEKIKSNNELLTVVGNTIRRLPAKKTFDKNGLARIWHQGARGVSLCSKVDRDKKLDNQTLTFFGLLLRFDSSLGIQTGTTTFSDDESTVASEQPTDSFEWDAKSTARTIEYGLQLLRSTGKRDYYIQHLFKLASAALNEISADSERTVVSTLDTYAKMEEAGGTGVKTQITQAPQPPPPTKKTKFLTLAILMLSAGALGFAAYLFLKV